MTGRRFNRHTEHMSITTALGVVVMLLLLSVSCGGDKKEIVAVEFDPDNTYTMRTTEIVSLISDSGITRYRITSPEWLMFDKASEPYWYFPQGLYMEQFDSLFVAEASFKADTAYYWRSRKLWKAIGNVEVENLEGERFETDTLYWNEETQRFYSEAFMRITRPDRVLTGIGFESNQNMSDYRIFNLQGSFPINEEKNDSTSRATTQSEVAPHPVGMPQIQRERPQRRQPNPVLRPDSIPAETEELFEEPVIQELPEKLIPEENEEEEPQL